VALLLVIGGWGLVTYAKSSIERGARWQGVAFDHGLALVFVCDPQTGINRAFFFVWPWRKVALEKRDPGA
jgi:hypothetical protein